MIRIVLALVAAARARRAPRSPQTGAAPRRGSRRWSTVTGDVVRIGDLVENAGAAAEHRRSSARPTSARPARCRSRACSRRCARTDSIGVDTARA